MARTKRKANPLVPELTPATSTARVYKAAGYVRLSVEDGGKPGADTLEGQKALIGGYIAEQADMQLVGLFCDNGRSGTDFARPQFEKLMDLVRKGQIDCIVVKDLSRFGRNYKENGNYLERIFPFLGVRFIAINDNFDTLTAERTQDGYIVPLKNLINEVYSKDISRKSGSALETKQLKGEFIGAWAPYGYSKDPENKNHLIVNAERGGSAYRRSITKKFKKIFSPHLTVADDGITGTTMKRPGFQKMIQAIEAGYISAVFVKDLSRLGRNYIEVGKLTEEFFPLHDVRLVAVSDGVDSDEGEDDFTPFKNIMNEYYAKDISKKRRIVNKMKGNAGIPLSPPPYGYIKNPDDPRFWVVDPEAADVVRRIYRMALEGYGLAETAAALGADGIVNPTYYWRSKGTSRGGTKSTLEPTKWGHTTIKKILTTQEYCGDVINFKSYSKSYKMKKRIENPEENRAIFLNVHEAIIDRPTWEKVQALKSGTRRKRPTVTQEPSVFSGVMKCPECGGNLNFHFNQNNHDIKFFSCQNHNSGLRKCSSTHYIRLDFLEQVVLYEVHRLACFANEYENDFIKAMVGRSAKVAENERVRKKRELDALLARDRELDALFERLYEDNVSGKIDDARFAKMAKRYEQEQGENARRIKTLRLEVKKLDEKRMDVEDFLETVRRYTDATKITKRMVAELIDHIEVYPAVKEDGVTNQRVTIHYNCIGVFEVPDRRKIPERDILLETRRGVALSYAPAEVAV